MWLSTTKYFSPSFSYTAPPVCSGRVRLVWTEGSGAGRQVEAQEVGGVLRVGEHDRPVVLVDHAAVVSGHALLELGRVEPALLLAGGLVDLGVDDVEAPDAVHPDHRRQVGHRDVRLGL